MIFPGFTLTSADVEDGVSLRLRHGGEGPAVVLLHGHPRTHTTWHRVAPLLAEDFTVVCPDLRGYGQSSKPQPDSAHHVHSDRTMARDIVGLMSELGHERFAVVGHDRGSYVAYRAALDHPGRVTHLAVLDGVPIVEALERVDAAFAQSWWHWFFFASPHAHRVITADPLAWYRPDRDRMGEVNYDDMVASVSNPDTVLAMLEDYRAVDEADRAAGRRIRCPTLVAWSAHDDLEDLHGDPTLVWARWCSGPMSGAVIDSGHHMAEEAPGQLATTLTDFLHA